MAIINTPEVSLPVQFHLWFYLLLLGFGSALAQSTEKPELHGKHWMAITGKPLGTMAGAKIFQHGGNAVDAACAMLAADCTMFDDVSWGGETQALIYDPRSKKVVGINALGVAPTGATPKFFQQLGMNYPPEDGPLAALTPGTAGGLMVMLAEYGTLSLKEVLEPAMEMAKGYPVESEMAAKIRNGRSKMSRWPYSRKLFYDREFNAFEPWQAGRVLEQPDLWQTLQKLVDAEAEALQRGKTRREAIRAAYDRFYKGDIAEEFVRGSKEQGGLHTREDLAQWEVKIEEPVMTTYKGIDVYKLTTWTQGPVLLQLLNLLEPLDLEGMGCNSARYIHTLYQAMNLAFADRDFYYGDPAFPPAEPITGLLSKDYADSRRRLIDPRLNNPDVHPGDPYPFEGKEHPFPELLRSRPKSSPERRRASFGDDTLSFEESFRAGTTSIQAADAAGWAVSITPSGGWLPVCIAGNTGIGMSQRMQSFVLEEKENPYNVLAPGKRPRVTLTPTIALRDRRPLLCFSVQGGDTQEQNLLQFFLNIVEFGMTVQEACEGANFTSYQMRSSFGKHDARPGKLTLNHEVPSWVRRELYRMGYQIDTRAKTSGPLTAIYFDWDHQTLWGGASNDGDDYGMAW